MHNDQESIEGLLHRLDDAISSRDRRYNSLDSQYKNDNGHIVSKEYDEYSRKKEQIIDCFKKEAIDCQVKIDKECKRIRKSQPVLSELSEIYINTKGRFPRKIALGKKHIQAENLDFSVPQEFSFPFERPMYICDETKTVLLHKVLLRMLFALPIEKQEYYIFDPIGLGKAVSKFNILFSNEKMFPQKKVMTTSAELKFALKEVANYILDLQSNVFNIGEGCHDWQSYNELRYSQHELRKMLPYKIFIFTSVPCEMDQECFDMFRKLILHAKQCGLFVLFSFDRTILNTEESKMKAMELQLKECIEKSVQLHVVFEEDDSENDYKNLIVKHIGEKFPDDADLSVMLNELKAEADRRIKNAVPFEELIQQSEFFGGNSANGLEIPIGYSVSGGSIVNLCIGDSSPHYLIGGATGSGKSNLLHDLILSVCYKYSPDELRVYLLDFKEGVEFCKYAAPALRHAALVATEADTEYGVTVLKHLVDEKERRYAAFKAAGCKDIQGYREKVKTEHMPRILLIVDEFQALFADSQKSQTIMTLEMLAKQGRACGIHLVMATQSLKGIDFSTIGSQFVGRIALKCTAEDSKILLGGITSNNEEASKIKIPFAIMNTEQGNISENVIFIVPEVKEQTIQNCVAEISKKCDKSGIYTKTKIFKGQTLPHRPIELPRRGLSCLEICFGEMMDYESEPFILGLKSSVENNLLICGHDKLMKTSLLRSAVLSSLNSRFCDEVIYVGDESELIDDDLRAKVLCLWSVKDFCEKYSDLPYAKRRVLIIDNCNIKKQIGEAEVYAATPEATFFAEYIDSANENGSHIIAFYDKVSKVKSCGVSIGNFNYRIGYSVNIDEKNALLGPIASSYEPVKGNRAFLVDQQELKLWFRPYAD